MTRADVRILDELQSNGRMSNQDLAEKVGMSTAACWRRVRQLEESGIIKRFSAVLSKEKLNLNFCAFVQITMGSYVKDSTEPFLDVVRERPEVVDCFVTTGDSDFIMRVVTEDIKSYNQFLEDFLFTLPQVSSLRSNIILSEVKEFAGLPLKVR